MAQQTYQEIFHEKSQNLVSYFQKLSSISTQVHSVHQAEVISEDIRNIQNETFHLVVVGEFSRGKSTFINAMLGKRILPSSKSPTTAVISKISYAEQPSYTLYFRNHDIKSLSEAEFKDLKAPKPSLDDTGIEAEQYADEETYMKSIEYAVVQYPLEFCKNHVEIIDTPGVNDISKERVEITYNYLNKADAAILLLSAKQILTKSEITFLKEQILGNRIQNIFIVINFKDSISKENWNEVITYTRDHLAEQIGTAGISNIFLVSSRQALTWRRKENGEELKSSVRKFLPDNFTITGFDEFEDALGQFLFYEKGKAKLHKYVSRSNDYYKSLNKSIIRQIYDLNQSTDALKDKLHRMQPVFEETKKNAEHVSQSLATALRNHEAELMLRCNNGLDSLQAAAEQAANGYELGMSYKKITDMIQEAMAPVQKAFYEDMNAFQRDSLNEEYNNAIEKINKLWQDLEISYNSDLTVPAQRDAQLVPVDNLTINESAIYRQAAEMDDLSANIALGGMAAIVVANPITLLGGVIFGFDNVFRVAKGIVGSILSLFSESPTTKARRQLKQQLRESFAKKNDVIRKDIELSYRKQCQQIVKSITGTLNGKVDDLQGQLQQVIKEKETQEEKAAQQITNLKYLQQELQDNQNKINEVLL